MQENQTNPKKLLHRTTRNALQDGNLGNAQIRIKQSEISLYRDRIQKLQQNKCAICSIELSKVVACLDHNHKTGALRGVLCANCNGIEGKIYNLANRAKRSGTAVGFLTELLDYIILHQTEPFSILHPLHRTEEEKRIKRNAKAREARAKRSQKSTKKKQD